MARWWMGLLASGLVGVQAAVVIQEVCYDPAGADAGLEWVELANMGSEAVDVGGWVLDCNGPNLVLPALALGPGQTLVIHNNALADSPPAGLELWYPATSLGNTHGFLGLWAGEQNQENLRDYLQYGSVGHSWESQAAEAGIWPLDAILPDVEQGHSLRRQGLGQGPTFWLDEDMPAPGEISTEVGAAEPGLPRVARLGEVWPNPFNPETRVTFHLPGMMPVRLSLVDLLGREVRVLENGLLPAGSHERRLLLDGEAAGCYFLRLQTAEHQEVRKLLLVK
jgi:hypothetical protein